ncbi:MAG TPA: hypothetical protein VGX03_25195 [Candidatus Binatia bacterium]|jgi:hypothetical protein|nr:hypothetical protein [Candidatus Binatia bacterium]
MAAAFPQDLLAQALSTLAVEDVPSDLVAALTTELHRATVTAEQGCLSLRVSEQLLAVLSAHGSLTFFLPLPANQGPPKRLATFDRRGRLLLLVARGTDGTLLRFKVRGLDGRFLGVVRGAASHLGWGLSDSVGLLEGKEGFALDRSLTLFRSVAYEDIDLLPPLDAPTQLPVGGGSTVLNVLALLAKDQGKTVLRYRGPYPSERLFATLCESFRYSGEPGVTRERFTRDAEEAAMQLTMLETSVEWQPHPHERFFPASHTCVQLRDGVEKLYDRGRIYYRPDLATSAQALRVLQESDGQVRYVASLMILGQALEDHLILDALGEIVERPAVKRNWSIRGAAQFSDEWKAMLARLIATESTPLLRPALWPVMDELTLVWGETPGELWTEAGNELLLHAGIVTAYREALARVRSAGESLLLAARFTSELARLIAPLVRARAQERMAGLSPEDQQVSLLFSSSEPPGLPDNELRAFLTRLALGEELPAVE